MTTTATTTTTTTTSSIRPPSRIDASVVLSRLDQRLGAVAPLLLDAADLEHGTDHAGGTTAHLLPKLMAVCADHSRGDARWLVLTAAFGAFPTPDQVLDFGRMIELTDIHHAESNLLGQIIDQPRRGRLDLPMRVVTHGVVVEVNYCARHATHTGIQRTVRETLPRWRAEHDLTAVAWADPYCAFRTLNPAEAQRVFAHAETPSPSSRNADTGPANDPHDVPYEAELVVPWRSSVVLPDVFSMQAKDQLAGLARFSGNTVSMIGYDLIPLTSPDTRPVGEANGTAAYLSMLKHAHRVAGISRSAVAEFRGFAHSLRAQGLPGPDVREVRLSSESLREGPEVALPRAARTRPVMLCLGAQEPHKNQRAALHAAERLWQEGLDFEVHLVGGRGWSDEVLKPAIDRLIAAGRPLLNLGRLSDADLLAEMRAADFAYFASLHEGFGLPVAESLACGTPVVTSNFGSQAEIGELGGCLMIDPRDDDDVASGIRTLLTDPAALLALRAQAEALVVRTWDEYAAELWDFVAPIGESS
jgi:glycosyltransferase involved in cell wall biosynthesis